MLRWIWILCLATTLGAAKPVHAVDASACSPEAIAAVFPTPPPCPTDAPTVSIRTEAQFAAWLANPTAHADIKQPISVAPGTTIATACSLSVKPRGRIETEGDLMIAAGLLEVRGKLVATDGDLILQAADSIRTTRSADFVSGGLAASAPRMILNGDARQDDTDVCYFGDDLRWIRRSGNFLDGDVRVEARAIDIAGDFRADGEGRWIASRSLRVRGTSSVSPRRTTFIDAPVLRISGRVGGDDIEIFAREALVTQPAVLSASGNLNFNDIDELDINGRLEADGSIQLIGSELLLRSSSQLNADGSSFLSASLVDIRGEIRRNDEVEIEADRMETSTSANISSSFSVNVTVAGHLIHRGTIERNDEVEIRAGSYRLTPRHVLTGGDCTISGNRTSDSIPATGCVEQP